MNRQQEVANHKSILLSGEHSVEKEVASLEFIHNEWSSGRLPKAHAADIAGLLLMHHRRVVINNDDKYPEKMRRQSTKVLKFALKDESVPKEVKENIQKVLDTSSTWNYFKAWLAGRTRK